MDNIQIPCKICDQGQMTIERLPILPAFFNVPGWIAKVVGAGVFLGCAVSLATAPATVQAKSLEEAGGAIVGGIGLVVGAILGLILIAVGMVLRMRGKYLQCDSCKAIVRAK